MSPNRRIALNVVATYGRSLYAMVCGLLTSRWALLALGEVDLGIYGVIGGLTIFVSCLNGLMAGAVSRFYAYSVGEAQKQGNHEQGLDECIRWFNVALTVHCLLPLILVAVGYPCGIWAIKNFLTIPHDRINDAIWVWRFTCLSAFVGMVTVPFSAMYNAKQEIAELTIYGVITTTLNLFAVYYMVSHPGLWLKKYALCMCLTAILPLFILALRSFRCFPECRIVPRFFWDRSRLKRLLKFAGATACGSISQILSIQGVAILVNKKLGPARNAALTIGNTVANQCMTLSGSFMGALHPAIINALGAGNDSHARSLAHRTCLLSGLAFLVFMLPLVVELDTVLKLWLKVPPEGLSRLATLMLSAFVLDRLTDGHWMIVLGYGKIFAYQIAESLALLSTFFFVAVFLFAGMGLESVGWGMILAKTIRMGVNLFYGRKLGGLSIRKWATTITLPLAGISILVLIVGKSSTYLFAPGIFRIVTVTAIMETLFVPLVWCFALDCGSRDLIRQKFHVLFLWSRGKKVLGQ